MSGLRTMLEQAWQRWENTIPGAPKGKLISVDEVIVDEAAGVTAITTHQAARGWKDRAEEAEQLLADRKATNDDIAEAAAERITVLEDRISEIEAITRLHEARIAAFELEELKRRQREKHAPLGRRFL